LILGIGSLRARGECKKRQQTCGDQSMLHEEACNQFKAAFRGPTFPANLDRRAKVPVREQRMQLNLCAALFSTKE
jgi:hypothetical protein